MGYFTEKPEDFDHFAEANGLKVYSYESVGEKNSYITKYPTSGKNAVRPSDNLSIGYNTIIRRLFTMHEELQKENKELQERLDSAWDTISDRMAQIEKFFQITNFPKKELTPWDLEAARRVYFDEIDSNDRSNMDSYTPWDRLDIETKFEYIRKAKKKSKEK